MSHVCTPAGTVSGFVPEKVRRGVTKGAEKSGIPEALGTGTNFVLPSSVPRRRYRHSLSHASPPTTSPVVLVSCLSWPASFSAHTINLASPDHSNLVLLESSAKIIID